MSESWPQDQTDTLLRLWEDGRTSGQIAQRMGITRNQVMGKAHRLGLKHERIVKQAVNYTPRVSKPKPVVNFMLRVPKPKGKKPPTPLKAQDKTSHPIPFLNADHTTCKWPLWSGPRTGLVCGATPIPTKPYCAFHYDKAFVELWRRRKAC